MLACVTQMAHIRLVRCERCCRFDRNQVSFGQYKYSDDPIKYDCAALASSGAFAIANSLAHDRSIDRAALVHARVCVRLSLSVGANDFAHSVSERARYDHVRHHIAASPATDQLLFVTPTLDLVATQQS